MSEVALKVGDKVAQIDYMGTVLRVATVTEIRKRTMSIQVDYGFTTIDYSRQRPEAWHKVTDGDITRLKDMEKIYKNTRQALFDTMNAYPTGKVSEG